MNNKYLRLHFAIGVTVLCVFMQMGWTLDLPLDFYGEAFLGKYLNSDTTRYNMDAWISVYGTIARHKDFTFYVIYRDDLDMAEQTGGVSLDPRYAHYYIVGGFDCTYAPIFASVYFVHDCIHDIDYDVEGTPVFNRFRIQCADVNFHARNRLCIKDRFLWNVELGAYPHWHYHGWDINSGADYQYDGIASVIYEYLQYRRCSFACRPSLHFIRGDSSWYHQHTIGLLGYYTYQGRRIGLDLTYNIWNNDPVKDPDKLWLLSLFVAF